MAWDNLGFDNIRVFIWVDPPDQCGYLLPRLSRFGLLALPINSILFALFHVWTPWMAVARAVGLIPLIYVAQKKRNIYIGMIAHILVNSLDVVTGVMFILSYK